MHTSVICAHATPTLLANKSKIRRHQKTKQHTFLFVSLPSLLIQKSNPIVINKRRVKEKMC